MATKKAKAIAFPILRQYVDTKGWSAFDIKSAAAHIAALIDAKLAEVTKEHEHFEQALSDTIDKVVKERDDWRDKCMKLNGYCEAVDEGIKTYKKALRELVEAIETEEREGSGRKPGFLLICLSNRKNNALAAAKKLLEDK